GDGGRLGVEGPGWDDRVLPVRLRRRDGGGPAGGRDRDPHLCGRDLDRPGDGGRQRWGDRHRVGDGDGGAGREPAAGRETDGDAILGNRAARGDGGRLGIERPGWDDR